MTTTGCLLIHGWTGAPFEMRPLVSPLADIGVDSRLVTLPGHASTFDDFCKTYFADWRRGAEEAFEAYSREVDQIFVCGLSMGGALALHLAQKYPVAGVISLAAPMYVYRLFPPEMKDWRLPLVPLLKRIRPVWPGRPRKQESQQYAPWEGYDGDTALPQLHSLMRGVRSVAAGLHNVTAPVLVAHCPTDKTAPASNAWAVVKGVSSTCRRLELLPIQEQITAHHVLTTHVETRQRVQDITVNFVREHASCIQNCK